MDPQQRLLLETGYEALHGDGGRLAWLLGDGGDVGVFVGIERPDWLSLPLPASAYTVTGGTVSIASGRLSFVLGLQGPCVSVDTACSSGWWRRTTAATRCGARSASARWRRV